ncbi:hypothetical protein SAMN06295987_102752 [Novosphingobium mathurense]|uniref:Uncharacterized protein n=1 Tax=Novosphingobium mathurense TaxID=428990 RepID=A0A1U6HM74_9SPHN|nr:hypothetical protein SAMN06295987_102752 [Novosphingobium mathurense]
MSTTSISTGRFRGRPNYSPSSGPTGAVTKAGYRDYEVDQVPEIGESLSDNRRTKIGTVQT